MPSLSWTHTQARANRGCYEMINSLQTPVRVPPRDDNALVPPAPDRKRRDFFFFPKAPLLSSTSLRHTFNTTDITAIACRATKETASRISHTVPLDVLTSKQSQAILGVRVDAEIVGGKGIREGGERREATTNGPS